MTWFRELGQNIERGFKDLGPRIQRSFEQGFKKPPPEVMTDIGEVVSSVGCAVGGLIFPPLPLISIFVGTIGPKVGHTVQRFFQDIGREAKKLEKETKKLGEQLQKLKELHIKDNAVYEKTKECFDKMAKLMDEAKEKLEEVRDGLKTEVSHVKEKIEQNKLVQALLQRRVAEVKQLKEDIRKELESVSKT